jgi:hypothetical protein
MKVYYYKKYWEYRICLIGDLFNEQILEGVLLRQGFGGYLGVGFFSENRKIDSQIKKHHYR